MKIVLIHNRYGLPGRGSGEEVAIDAISRLLREKGHIVVPYIRSSLEVEEMKLGKPRAFFSGIYNINARKEMKKLLEKERPDLVLAQNVFPLLSPSVLAACRQAKVPVIMRCPNYRLVCPNGLFLQRGKVCEACAGGKEYWCILKDCERDIFKSTGYALRSFVARQFSLFENNVDVFLSLTEFARKKLVQNGFPSNKVQVIYALADPDQIKPAFNGKHGRYVAFVGRVSQEKGIDTLFKASERLPEVPFKIAGKYNDIYLNLVHPAPTNVEFMGQLDREALQAFYANARMIVVPSRCYEGLPMVIIEAMLSGRPVICSDIGGLSEIVEDNSTGLLFRPDSTDDFVEKVRRLWNDPGLCRRLGMNGRKKAEREYNPDAFHERLMNAYQLALRIRSQRQSA